MKIKTFYLNSTKEIIVKIVKEILVLFKVEINDADDTIFDYDELKIENIYDDVALNGVKTVLTLSKDEKLWTYTRQSFLHDDESVKAGTNRLIKLNLYHIFCEDLQAKKLLGEYFMELDQQNRTPFNGTRIRPSRCDRTFTR